MQKLFAAALLFAPAAAHAENWVAVTLTDDSSGFIIVDAEKGRAAIADPALPAGADGPSPCTGRLR